MKYLPGQLFTLENSDKKLALFFIGIGIIAVILTTTVFPSLLILQASVTLLLASAIYLFLRTRRRVSPIEEDDGKSTSTTLLQPHLSKLLDIAFWGLLIAGLIILSQGLYARPLSFLILVSIMSSILAVQIFTGKNTAYCLIKIVIIGLLLRATAYYQFPGMVGYDSVAEVNFLRQLVANGHIGDFMKGYQHYPLAYYFTAATSFITGLGAKDSFFVLGIIEVISLVFLFLIGRQLFNEKTGLLAVLIMAVFDWHVRWGFYVKAMTLGIALVPIIIYLLLNSRRKGNPAFLILGILSMFLIVLTHTFVTAVLLVILFFSWLIFRTLRNIQSKKEFEPPITLNIVLLLFVTTFAYWMFASGFTKYVLYAINYALSFDVSEVALFVLPTSTLQVIWMRLPIFILIFFTILGVLSIFNIKNLGPKALLRVWLALLCGAMVVISFIIFYAPQISGTLVTERWFVFLGLIAAIPAANGLLSISGRKGRQSLVMMFLLMFLFSGIMTTSYIGSVDSVVSWEPQSHGAATKSELVAADTVGRIAMEHTLPGETRIYADHYYSQIFLHDVRVPAKKVVNFTYLQKEELKEYHGILMLRAAVTNIISAKEELLMDQSQYQSLTDDPQIILMYNNGMVKALKR